jgi:nucleoid DNA-binding protein
MRANVRDGSLCQISCYPGGAKVHEIVQRVFDGLVETLVKEGRIELRNFGVLQVKERKPRKARNPRTGEAVAVPKKFVVTFKPGREMEEQVRQLKEIPRSVQVAVVE